ncbi:DM13 domain-containing protein [Ahrensia sp. R2A130]|uniref:DM13 domain-containing protein n=1 Tax=Ahrensia sp. R2A130 TaxID=744979 RepID=UPI0001E0F840|nr:DM13 domain-containing protein [Ahrensia sp. R2A130]EFL90488.1 twin-arginine translocation pathway signal sequence domain-containing protein [Ahrensia sp. R2A130]
MSFTTLRAIAPGASAALALGLMLATTNVAKVMAAEEIATGSFYGESKHVTTGSVTIERDGDKVFVVLGENFSLDGAPNPTLGFTKDGKFDKATEFSDLKKLNGRQVYELPKGIMVSAYDAITVWCAKFAVPLGSAKLK